MISRVAAHATCPIRIVSHRPPTERPLPSRTKRDVFILSAFAALAITAVVVGIKADWFTLGSLWTLLIRMRDAHGTGVLFVLLFIGVAAVGLPITPLVLIGGVLFGVWMGVLLSWVGSVIGAVIGYYLARKLGKNAFRRLVERMAGRHVHFSGRKARRTLFRLRLIPLTPFGGVNFAAGLAGMRMKDFLIATAVGIIPSILIFAFFASRVLSGGKAARQEAIVHTLIAAAVLWALTYAPALWDRLFGSKDDDESDQALPESRATAA